MRCLSRLRKRLFRLGCNSPIRHDLGPYEPTSNVCPPDLGREWFADSKTETAQYRRWVRLRIVTCETNTREE